MQATTRRTNVVLWILQGVLAALFLFAGGFKLAMPMAALAKVSPLPAAFLKLIGLCEVAGALGLVLPGALRLRRGLTPLAAAGLVLIMIGAVVVTVATQGVAQAVFPGLVGALAATVARGRGFSLRVGSRGSVTHRPFQPAGR
jgi:DoxX-like family